LPPRLLNNVVLSNTCIKAGLLKFLFLIILFLNIPMALKAQTLFTIDNQSTCDWPLVIYCTGYSACKPLIQPPISIIAPQNAITTVDPSTYYPWTNAVVIQVDVFNFRYQTWETIIDPYCGVPISTSVMACPFGGGVWYTATFSPFGQNYFVTIN